MYIARALALAALIGLAAAGASHAAIVGTAFTYQGALNQGAVPANGLFDFRFDLHFSPDGPTPSNTVELNDVMVSDGIFTVTLDFGVGYIVGDAVWLQVGVRPGASQPADPYTALSPRQKLHPTPYALSLALPYSANTATTDSLITLSQNGLGRGLFVLQHGLNTGIQSNIVNNSNENHAVLAATNGTGSALWALSSGSGRAGTFSITQANNSDDAVLIETAGTGNALNAGATGSGTGVLGRADSTGVGVHGVTDSNLGVGVKAEGNGGTALEIQNGAIKVTNAGQSSATPVFVHVATEPNSTPCDLTGCFCYETVIDNKFCNNKPDAVLIVTVNGESGNSGQGDPILERVEYDTEAGRWVIRAQFDNYFCHGQKFNVLVINN